MNYTIRKATLDDIQSLINLRVALLKEVGELYSQKEEDPFRLATKQYLQTEMQTKQFVAYVVEVNGTVVSISGITFSAVHPILKT